MTDSQQFKESRFRAHRESKISKSLIFREIGSILHIESPRGEGVVPVALQGPLAPEKGGDPRSGEAPLEDNRHCGHVQKAALTQETCSRMDRLP